MTSLGAGALNWRMDLQIAFDSVKFSLINMTSIHLGPASQSADVVITLLIADSSYLFICCVLTRVSTFRMCERIRE